MSYVDKEMEEIFVNYNTPFGLALRDLDGYLNKNFGEMTDCGRMFPTSTVIVDYLDGIITPEKCYKSIVNTLAEYDLVHTDKNGKVICNSDDQEFIGYMKKIGALLKCK